MNMRNVKLYDWKEYSTKAWDFSAVKVDIYTFFRIGFAGMKTKKFEF